MLRGAFESPRLILRIAIAWHGFELRLNRKGTGMGPATSGGLRAMNSVKETITASEMLA